MANYRNKKIIKFARGQICQFQGPTCSYNNDTVVFCHLDEMFAGKGTGIKSHDFAGFFGCHNCHTYYHNAIPKITDWLALRAVVRTLAILFNEGVIK